MNPLLKLSALWLLACLAFVPFALASAASHYGLDPRTDASDCFLQCHESITSSLTLPDGSLNQAVYIAPNCRNEQYLDLMTQCIPQYCDSASSAAYAAEYAVDYCARAGVQIDLQLPEAYVARAPEYFAMLATSSSKPQFEDGRLGIGAGVVVASIMARIFL